MTGESGQSDLLIYFPTLEEGGQTKKLRRMSNAARPTFAEITAIYSSTSGNVTDYQSPQNMPWDARYGQRLEIDCYSYLKHLRLDTIIAEYKKKAKNPMFISERDEDIFLWRFVSKKLWKEVNPLMYLKNRGRLNCRNESQTLLDTILIGKSNLNSILKHGSFYTFLTSTILRGQPFFKSYRYSILQEEARLIVDEKFRKSNSSKIERYSLIKEEAKLIVNEEIRKCFKKRQEQVEELFNPFIVDYSSPLLLPHLESTRKALMDGNIEELKKIILKGVEIDSKFVFSVREVYKNKELIRLLCDAGANPNDRFFTNDDRSFEILSDIFPGGFLRNAAHECVSYPQATNESLKELIIGGVDVNSLMERAELHHMDDDVLLSKVWDYAARSSSSTRDIMDKHGHIIYLDYERTKRKRRKIKERKKQKNRRNNGGWLCSIDHTLPTNLAQKYSRKELVSILDQAYIDSIRSQGRYQLLTGIRSNKIDDVRSALDKGETPNILHIGTALKNNSLSIAELLASKIGFSSSREDRVYLWNLYFQSGQDNPNILKLISNTSPRDVSLSSITNLILESGKHVLTKAIDNGFFNVVEYLLVEGQALPTMGDAFALIKAISKRNVDQIDNITYKLLPLLLKKLSPLTDINQIDENSGSNLLHLATDLGNLAAVKILVEGKAQVDVLDNDGDSSLLIAAHSARDDIVAHLLKSGADIHRKSPLFGYTAMHLAAVSANAEKTGPTIQTLINHLSTEDEKHNLINDKAYDGNTVLHISSKTGDLNSVKLLLHHKADPRLLDELCLSPFDWACYFQHSEVQDTLYLAHPTDPKTPPVNLYSSQPTHPVLLTPHQTKFFESAIHSPGETNVHHKAVHYLKVIENVMRAASVNLGVSTHTKTTFGSLIKELDQRNLLPDEILLILKPALELRNAVTHKLGIKFDKIGADQFASIALDLIDWLSGEHKGFAPNKTSKNSNRGKAPYNNNNNSGNNSNGNNYNRGQFGRGATGRGVTGRGRSRGGRSARGGINNFDNTYNNNNSNSSSNSNTNYSNNNNRGGFARGSRGRGSTGGGRNNNNNGNNSTYNNSNSSSNINNNNNNNRGGSRGRGSTGGGRNNNNNGNNSTYNNNNSNSSSNSNNNYNNNNNRGRFARGSRGRGSTGGGRNNNNNGNNSTYNNNNSKQ